MTKTSKTTKKPLKRGKYGPICIKCPEARFLDPTKEICYKMGGLYCGVLKIIVGKYDPCRLPEARGAKKVRGLLQKRGPKGGRS